MNKKCLCVALATFLCATSWSQIFYALDDSGDLYTIDAGFASATLVGSTGVASMTSIAAGPTGEFFGSGDSGNIYSINATTGAATLVGASGLGFFSGLDFAGTTLVGSNISDPTGYYTINQATGLASALWDADSATGIAQTFSADSSTFYHLVPNGLFQDLVSVDVFHVATNLGSTLHGTPIRAMEFDDTGGLFAIDSLGAVGLLNINNGSFFDVSINTGGQSWTALTYSPVPEPGTMIALGVGIAALARRRRKKS